MTYGFQLVALFVVVLVISTLVGRRRQAARQATAVDFARQRGLVPVVDGSPILGAYEPIPPPVGIGVAGPRPHVLEAVASRLGTVRSPLRGRTSAGEVAVFDYRMPAKGGGGSSHLFATWAAFRVPGVPTFHLFPRPPFAIGMKFVDFEGAPGVARRFAILPADEAELRRCFTPAVLAACQGLPEKRAWQISAGGGWVLATFGLAQQGELGVLLDSGERVAAALQAASRAAQTSTP